MKRFALLRLLLLLLGVLNTLVAATSKVLDLREPLCAADRAAVMFRPVILHAEEPGHRGHISCCTAPEVLFCSISCAALLIFNP